MVDLLTPTRERYDRFLYVVPGVAALSWGLGATLLIGLASAVVAVLLDRWAGDPLVPGALANAVVLLSVSAVCAVAGAVRARRTHEAERLAALAEVAQRALLRPPPRNLGTVQIDLAYHSAVDEARVGGDFYKALRVDSAVRVIVGDVQGKGLAAVETAAVALSSFREWAYECRDLREIPHRIEASMERLQERAAEAVGQRFASVVLVEIPDDEPIARVVSCGHPPPVLSSGGKVSMAELEDVSPPLHLAAPVPLDVRVTSLPFAPGDWLLLYSDGISEARTDDGTFYPLTRRAERFAASLSQPWADALLRDAESWSTAERDDATALVLHRVPLDTTRPQS
ncbi:PP2C family protein-serine/threonine phosphatase [Streptomyces sp. MW-W600-10]|uniref:PP2C family protein-serine/threonine phosphatase n=1 Tax=Streptomyces sp. MW-W600-10 TaxID=2829819 RepID=UPI001C4579BC|nr:PP2C family protein-serine/threonine phosphatase [Streptomyces sp. MW-W600-10]MBV7248406.1 serine/threonine-protein phosphatase [Streptomyces sp. MW-W600-10]